MIPTNIISEFKITGIYPLKEIFSRKMNFYHMSQINHKTQQAITHLQVNQIEVCTGRIFQFRPGPARMATIPARPKVKKKISARARPERETEILARAQPGLK